LLKSHEPPKLFHVERGRPMTARAAITLAFPIPTRDSACRATMRPAPRLTYRQMHIAASPPANARLSHSDTCFAFGAACAPATLLARDQWLPLTAKTPHGAAAASPNSLVQGSSHSNGHRLLPRWAFSVRSAITIRSFACGRHFTPAAATKPLTQRVPGRCIQLAPRRANDSPKPFLAAAASSPPGRPGPSSRSFRAEGLAGSLAALHY